MATFAADDDHPRKASDGSESHPGDALPGGELAGELPPDLVGGLPLPGVGPEFDELGPVLDDELVSDLDDDFEEDDLDEDEDEAEEEGEGDAPVKKAAPKKRKGSDEDEE